VTDIDMSPDPTKLMLAGDTHHSTHWVLGVIAHAANEGVDTIVQVGDFGYWPTRADVDDYFLERISKSLRHHKIRLFWIDGNHDDHGALTPGMRHGLIQHLPRGFRWQWWGKDWMAVGGGVSVDKKWRTPGLDWFPEETLSMQQAEHCCRPGNVDIILSHDAPDGVDIPGLDDHATPYPPECITESNQHRKVLGEICNAVLPQLVVHGHYHIAYRSTRLRDGRPATRVIGLNRDNNPLHESTVTLTKESYA